MFNLTQEEINFIKNLSKEIKEQDTRGTAQPYGLVITQRVVRRTEDGIADEFWCYWYDTEYSENKFQDFLDDIAEYYGKNSQFYENFKKAGSFKNIYNNYDLMALAETIDADIYPVSFNNEVDLSRFNFFLTEKAANEYIEKDKHNLYFPSTYGVYLRKNDEFKNLINIIHKIAEQLEK